MTDFHCNSVQFFVDEDPSDVTTSVQPLCQRSGNKTDPLFHFEYGFSFILLKSSFLLTELAALFSIVVYMAKRDERTFNRYKIRSLLNFSVVRRNGIGERRKNRFGVDSRKLQQSTNAIQSRTPRGVSCPDNF
ncbi:hypothetical protein OSTOST_17043 [Ostertagia ostertagi]